MVVQGVGVVVVGGIGPVEALQPLLLLLHKVGVGARAGGGQAGQAAVGPWLIPGGDGWRRWSGAQGGGRSGDLRWHGDGRRGRRLRGDRNWDGGHTSAVVGVVGGGVVVLLLLVVEVLVLVLVERERRRSLGRSLAVVVVVVLCRHGG